MKQSNQMCRPDVIVEKKVAWENFSGGFFRKNGDGKIFFAASWYGGGMFRHVVYEDGTVSRMPCDKVVPEGGEVEVISQESLGIKTVLWNNF